MQATERIESERERRGNAFRDENDERVQRVKKRERERRRRKRLNEERVNLDVEHHSDD